MGPRVGVERRKISSPPGFDPGTPARSSIAIPNELPGPQLTYSKGKDKAVPLQAWTGPEGSRKLRFPDLVTTAQDGG